MTVLLRTKWCNVNGNYTLFILANHSYDKVSQQPLAGESYPNILVWSTQRTKGAFINLDRMNRNNEEDCLGKDFYSLSPYKTKYDKIIIISSVVLLSLSSTSFILGL